MSRSRSPRRGGMQIFIKTEHKTITLDVDASDTIASVKAQIHAKEGIPVDQQWSLGCGLNDWLSNSGTLLDYKIKDKDWLSLKTVSKITVNTISGKVIPLEVFACVDTIIDLKIQIQIKEGIPVNQQRLIFDGKEVFGLGGNPLVYHNIIEGAEVTLIRAEPQTEYVIRYKASVF